MSGRGRSARAENDLRAVLDKCLPRGYDLEVIDLSRQPSRAETDSIVAAPTVVRLSPPPVYRVFGDLTDAQAVCRALALPMRAG